MGFKDQLKGNVGNGAKKNYFDPEDFLDAYVLLIEPIKYVADATNPFYDEVDPRSKPTRQETTADITVFETPEHLEAGTPSSILDATVITNPYLAGDLKGSVGGVEVARIALKPNKKGKPSKVWRAAEGNVIDMVEAYYDKREAEKEDAEAELADVEI